MARTSDEEVARRLQAQYDAEFTRTSGRASRGSASRGASAAHAPTVPVVQGVEVTPSWSNVHTGSKDLSEWAQEDLDAQMARKVEQEMSDAALAARLSKAEAAAESAPDPATQQVITEIQDQDRKRRRRRCLAGIVVLCALAGLAVGLIFGLGWDDDIRDALGSIGDNPDVTVYDENGDPIDDPSSSYAWRTDGKGLRLDVLNALGNKWQQHCDTAIKNWNNCPGYDAVRLTEDAVAEDKDCLPISVPSGKVKLCSGNYGDTGWKGLANVLVSFSSRIVKAAAKMNDFYFPDNDPDEMIYTCCHEAGKYES